MAAERAAPSPRVAHGLSVFAALTVALLLLLPAPAGPPGWLADQLPAALSAHLDKVVHAALFFALAAIWRRSFERLPGLSRPVSAAVLLAAGYGAALEGLQAFTPERSTSPGDVAANLFGALVFGVVASRFRREPECR
jgi:VanZ family protein